MVLYKWFVVIIFFRLFLGFLVIIKGYVCRREEGGGGKWLWRRGGMGWEFEMEGEGVVGVGSEV